ncbi:RHS repeat-associated core domain-containing protein [Treponema pedis]|uniref:RHS repeat-associated core domain-containing protein n=1 Tax=Treponema pedis TaxID=409322 RepID=UPI0009B7496C
MCIISDHIGRPIQAIDDNGELVWSADYDIYGRLKNVKGERTFIPFRQAGQIEDAELEGLYYNRYRWYNSNTGIYISQDPIGLAGGNPTIYGYVKDPNIQIDPLGLMSKKGNDAIKQKAPIDFGNGYRGRKDSFNYKGESDFEIHIYKIKGNSLVEVGVIDSAVNWINKHGHTSSPELPAAVMKKVKKLCNK